MHASSHNNRHSIRLKNYDYCQAGAYFTTICTQDRACDFGNVIDGEMYLNEIGRIASQCWHALPQHFPKAELDGSIFMPNHLHGIIVLPDAVNEGTACRAPTEQFSKPVPGSIPTMVRSFKSAVTRLIHQQGITRNVKFWQRNYWEHIVRDESELHQLRDYIENNPKQWALDKFYVKV
ncbi:MAG: transposase [Pseudomonadota bacterium]